MLLTRGEKSIIHRLPAVALTNLADRAGLTEPLSSARAFARRPRQTARNQVEVLHDYLAFRQDFSFLSALPRAVSSGPTVLIVSLDQWVARVKIEGLLTAAFQMQGYTPVILTNRAFPIGQRYLRMFGCRQFIFLEDFLRAVPNIAVTRGIRQLGSEPASFDRLLGFEYRGVQAGEHVLSTIARMLRLGSVNLADPYIARLAQRMFARAVRSILAAERLIEKLQPRIVLVLDKGYTPAGELFDVAINRKVQVIEWHHAHTTNALALKRYTARNRFETTFSLDPATWQRVRAEAWTGAREIALNRLWTDAYHQGNWFNRRYLATGQGHDPADALRARLRLDPSKKTAVVFSHILWDSAFFQKNLFRDYEDWLVETMRAAAGNRQVNWILKLHPDYVLEQGQPRELHLLRAAIGVVPQHITVLEPETDINPLALFGVADYGVTVRGTVGLEMPCLGIPVLTAGVARYSGLGFTIDSDSKDQYLDRLSRIQDIPPLQEERIVLAKKHAYALLTLRPCVFETFDMVRTSRPVGHPLAYNVNIRARRPEDITQATDLQAFGDWAVGSSAPDFMTMGEG